MLTVSSVKNAKPKAKAYKLADERAMYLLVTPAGGKLWRFKYRRPAGRRENVLALGAFPDVSLAQARERREEARKALAAGIDPAEQRRAAAAAGVATFEAVAREYIAKSATRWSASNAAQVTARLEHNVFPWMGRKPVADVTAADVLAVVQRIAGRGAVEVAHRVQGSIGQVLRFAMATQRASMDVTAALRGALPSSTGRHFGTITEPAKVGELLRAIDGYSGSFVTRAALELAPLVFVRPGELRAMEWAELDWAATEWRIPAERMKMGEAHVVPLASQAVSILQDLRPLTAATRYVFPSVRSARRPMSENTITAALRRLGYPAGSMTGHGFRAMASTLLNERGWAPDVIERQLAHKERNLVRAAYNHAEYMAERRKMMQAWADYLDELRTRKSSTIA
ncbi:MAG: DUF4102 domain-containing protein [Rhodanobacteraceae bacterium]|nr:MAG: DUF4102 domain-containing protein [Rhodanobacteraceae bacterium]